MDYLLIVAAGAFVIGLLLLTSSGQERWRRSVVMRLDRIERQNQLIMDHLGITPPTPDYPEVRALLEQGKKIEAIKAYRKATDAGLKEAKDAVDAMERT